MAKGKINALQKATAENQSKSGNPTTKTRLSSILIVPGTVVMIALGIATCVMMWRFSDELINILRDTMIERESLSVSKRLDGLIGIVQIQFNFILDDVGLLQDYADRLYNGEFDVIQNYTLYDGLNHNSIVFPINFDPDLFGAWYSYTGDDTYRGTSSVMANVFRPQLKSTDGVQSVYVGHETTEFTSHPYSDQRGRLTMQAYDCERFGTRITYYDPRCRIWYEDARTSGNVGLSDLYSDATTNEAIITAYAPVYKSNVFIGALGLDISMAASGFETLITESVVMENGYFFMYDNKGNVLFHPNLFDRDEIYKIYDVEFTSTIEKNDFEGIYLNMRDGFNGTANFTKDGEEWYISYATNNNIPYGIAAVVPVADVEKSSNDAAAATIGAIIAMIIAVIVLVIVGATVKAYKAKKFATSVTKDYKSLTDGLRNMREGKFVEMTQLKCDVTEIQDANTSFMNFIHFRRFASDKWFAGQYEEAYKNFMLMKKIFHDIGNTHGEGVADSNIASSLAMLTDWKDHFTRADTAYNNAIKNAMMHLKEECEKLTEMGAPDRVSVNDNKKLLNNDLPVELDHDGLEYDVENPDPEIRRLASMTEHERAQNTINYYNKTLGTRLANYAVMIMNSGVEVQKKGDVQHANTLFAESIAMSKRAQEKYQQSGENLLGFYEVDGNIGAAHRLLGEYDVAEDLFNKAYHNLCGRFDEEVGAKGDATPDTKRALQYASMNLGIHYASIDYFVMGHNANYAMDMYERAKKFLIFALRVTDRVDIIIQRTCVRWIVTINRMDLYKPYPLAQQEAERLAEEFKIATQAPPYHVRLLMDISASMTHKDRVGNNYVSYIDQSKAQVKHTLIDGYLKNNDVVSMSVFGEGYWPVVENRTVGTHKQNIFDAIDAQQATEDGTMLYDSINNQVDELLKSAMSNTNQMIVVTTDGVDNRSTRFKYNGRISHELVSKVQNNDLRVVVIWLGPIDNASTRRAKEDLKRLTHDSRTGKDRRRWFVQVESISQLGSVLQTVGESISVGQYKLETGE
jgi:tetratricopeptide (TPR) repeat protein